MSIATWEEEFAQHSAKFIAETKGVGPIRLIEYDLSYWKGLRKKNLEKHNLEIEEPDTVYDHDYDQSHELLLRKNSALCQRYLNTESRYHTCVSCPIMKSSEAPCSVPYYEWVKSLNPEPMIEALEDALRVQRVKLKLTQAKRRKRERSKNERQ